MSASGIEGQDRVTLELVPHYSTLEPAVHYQIDAEANEIHILAEGEVVAVLSGSTTFDHGDLNVTVVGVLNGV